MNRIMVLVLAAIITVGCRHPVVDPAVRSAPCVRRREALWSVTIRQPG